MRTIALILLICPSFIFPLLSQTLQPKAATALKESLVACTKRITQNPRSAPLYMARGDVYYSLGQHARAIADFARAIRIDPAYADAYYYRAVCREQLKDTTGAEGDLKKAISLNNREPVYYSQLAGLYVNRQKYGRALEQYDAAIALAPEDGTLYLLRGTCRYVMKQFKKAIPDFSRAITLKHQPARSHLLRGNCYKELEVRANAVKDYTRVISLDPENFRAYFYRGFLYLDIGQKKAGINDLNEFLKLQAHKNPSVEEVRKAIRKHGGKPLY